jgi:hypothetical protein
LGGRRRVTLVDLEELFSRVARITGKLHDKAGPGTSWDYTFPDGSTTTYEITNVKTPEELQDQFANLAVWTWSIKDYLKRLSMVLGTTPQAIEEHVNRDPTLPLCADLANMLKHGELTSSRSGKWPVSVKPSYVIRHDPRAAATPIKSIVFTAAGVRLDISNPALVEIEFKVTAKSGEPLPDGLQCLADAISSWESLLGALELIRKLC